MKIETCEIVTFDGERYPHLRQVIDGNVVWNYLARGEGWLDGAVVTDESEIEILNEKYRTEEQ